MTKSLARSLGGSRKTKWRGQTVHAVAQLAVRDGDTITVTRNAASATRAQALKIAVDRGDIRANGIQVPTVAIWTHTAPEVATLTIVGKRARSVDIWNAWSFAGVDSSWMGGAGMIIESTGSANVVRCSDGIGEPSFDALICTVEVKRG